MSITTALVPARRWVPEHRRLWETEHGPIPAGHVVAFKDGDKQNVTLDNLVLMTRAELQ